MSNQDRFHSTIVSLPTICNSFPTVPTPNIEREVHLDTIDELFISNNIVIVEGNEGNGKTTLLAQYAMRHAQTAVSLFIRPSSRYSYDLDILILDLCNQVNWILSGEELSGSEEVSESLLRKYLFFLGRKSRQETKIYYIILDGLYEIPARDAITQDQILELLPFGNSRFKFLLSCRNEDTKLERKVGEPAKRHFIGGFSLDETRRFLGDYQLTESDIDALHRICQKNPSHLASIRRILNTGRSLEALFQDPPDTLVDLFEIEWSNVSEDHQEQLLLSIISHDVRRHSITELEYLTDIPENQIHKILQGLGFLAITDDSISFISESMRSFASARVLFSKDEIIDIIISKLLNSDTSETSLANNLPNYFYEGNRLAELINYLTDDYFAHALIASQSVSFIKHMASLGLETAKKLADDSAVIRFSVYCSLISELSIAETWRSEVEALMELNDYDAAISIAQSAKLREDRIHLLAAIARKKREQHETPEPELIEEIQNLSLQIDFSNLSNERSTEIAMDLLYSVPDIAIEVIEKSQGVNEGYDSLDWALAKLSFEALRSDADINAAINTSEKIRSRIKDPNLRRMSDEISIMLNSFSSEEILSEIEKLEDATDKLYLLRHWTVSNRRDEASHRVITEALKILVHSTAFTPNARLFRELATPLPYISDTSVLQSLIAKFDSQSSFCEQYGPTEDYVRLQLLLARAAGTYDDASMEDRVLDVYFYISNLQNYLIKAECMARLLATLHATNRPDIFEAKHGLYQIAEQDLNQYFQDLLDNSAEQHETTKRIIRSLAKKIPQLAISYAVSLNLPNRRDAALLDVTDALLDTPDNQLNLLPVTQALDSISDVDLKDVGIFNVSSRLARVNTSLEQSVIDDCRTLLNASNNIRSASQRCEALCNVYLFIVSQQIEPSSLLSFEIESELRSSYDCIDVSWIKADIGFRITKLISRVSLDLGREYLSYSQNVKMSTPLCNDTIASAYSACIRLSILALDGLISNKIVEEEDVNYLLKLIERIPSIGHQAELFSEIALRYFLNKQTDKAKEIVSNRIRPLIESMPEDDSFYRDEVIAITSPSLYLDNRIIAHQIISTVSKEHQNIAYATICEFYLRKRPLSEPFDQRGVTYYLDYEETLEICELIPKFTSDQVIYHQIQMICESLCRRNSPLNRNQKLDIVTKLEVIANLYLPTADGISHDGYKIVAFAQINRLKKTNVPDWENLASQATALSNSADKALVLCTIAEAMPNKYAKQRQQFLEDTEKIIADIPSVIDRAERYEALAWKSIYINQQFSRRILNLAIETASLSDDPEMDSIHRRLIDMAYRIDPEFASSLSSLADNDPARIRAKMVMSERLRVNEIKSTMEIDQTSEADLRAYSRASNMYLAALNAGRVNTLSPQVADSLMSHVSAMPLRRAYPMLSLVTRNFTARYANDDQGIRYIKPYFDVSLLSAQLVENVSQRVLRDIEVGSKHIVIEDSVESLLVEPGNRERAIEFVTSWIRDNVEDYLIICDGYFGIDDLDVIQLVSEVNNQCEISILTSVKNQEGLEHPISETYRLKWRLDISDMPPPITKIIIAGSSSSKTLPIHDRWWITKNSGLRLGTSWNGLGKRSTEISILQPAESAERESEIRQYLDMKKRTHDGQRILYESFML